MLGQSQGHGLRDMCICPGCNGGCMAVHRQVALQGNPWGLRGLAGSQLGMCTQKSQVYSGIQVGSRESGFGTRPHPDIFLGPGHQPDIHLGRSRCGILPGLYIYARNHHYQLDTHPHPFHSAHPHTLDGNHSLMRLQPQPGSFHDLHMGCSLCRDAPSCIASILGYTPDYDLGTDTRRSPRY